MDKTSGWYDYITIRSGRIIKRYPDRNRCLGPDINLPDFGVCCCLLSVRIDGYHILNYVRGNYRDVARDEIGLRNFRDVKPNHTNNSRYRKNKKRDKLFHASPPLSTRYGVSYILQARSIPLVS